MARLDMRMICYYLSLFVLFKIGMEDPDPKTRQQLAAASDHFAKKEYPQARKYPPLHPESSPTSRLLTSAVNSTLCSASTRRTPPR